MVHLSLESIDKQLTNQLFKKGLKKVRASNTRKMVLKFEKDTCAKGIFEAINKKPFLRTLLQIILREKTPVTKDQVRQILEDNKSRLKEVLQESPDKNLLCRNCSQIIQGYNIYYDDKPRWKLKCPACHTPNELGQCQVEDDWSFPIISVASYLDELVLLGLLTSEILGSCNRCMTNDSIEPIRYADFDSYSKSELRDYVQKLYCKKCFRFYDLVETYSPTELTRSLWISDCIWLEWYTKNMIKKYFPTCLVDQGIIVSNEETIEVDVVLLKNDRIISFECKDLSVKKNASFNDVSDVLKLLDFSDEVFLVTTTKLKDNDKKLLLKRGSGILKIVETSQIEKISRLVEG